MNATMIKSTYKSRDGIHDISYHVWFPQGTVRGIIQISHGMCEYIMRYKDFAEFLAGHGFVVCGNDHLGHGESVNSDDELGYFCEKDGWQTAVDDLHTLTNIMKKSYPDLPYFMLGHSMGSFLARAYCIKYGREPDAVIFCGTSGGIKGIPGLLSVISQMELVHGDKYRSKVINHMAFGAYNRKIPASQTPYDWISRDTDIVDKYRADDKCTFIFTLNGFENLMKVLWYVNNDKWYSAFRKDLPVFLIAGDGDPVGDYGRGVQNVFDKMRDFHCDARLKIYPGARHELLNETLRGDVYNDVLEFISMQCEPHDL